MKKIEISAPLSGKLIDISKVDDITFSEKFLGDGIAIIPTDSKLLAPADGQIIQVFHTKHALGINIDGVEILIHVGINTVELKGQGFDIFVKDGDFVKKGEQIANIDFKFLEEKGYPIQTPIVITNMDIIGKLNKLSQDQVLAGKDIIIIIIEK